MLTVMRQRNRSKMPAIELGSNCFDTNGPLDPGSVWVPNDHRKIYSSGGHGFSQPTRVVLHSMNAWRLGSDAQLHQWKCYATPRFQGRGQHTQQFGAISCVRLQTISYCLTTGTSSGNFRSSAFEDVRVHVSRWNGDSNPHAVKAQASETFRRHLVIAFSIGRFCRLGAWKIAVLLAC